MGLNDDDEYFLRPCPAAGKHRPEFFAEMNALLEHLINFLQGVDSGRL